MRDSSLGRGFRVILLLAVLLTVLVGVGLLVPSHPRLAVVGAVGVLALGIASISPSFIPLLCVPVLILVARVSIGGVQLSVSDVALATATLPALAFGQRPYSTSMRTLLWLNAGYQFATLFTVVNNPYTANAVEWVHAWFLISGALVVGWTVGRHGAGRLGLTLLMGSIVLLALVTLVQATRQYLSGDFSEVYVTWPYDMHKNFVGGICAIGATIAYVRPVWTRWSSRVALPVFGFLVAAILVTQSRQALIGLVASLVVVVLRTRSDRRRSKLVLLLAVPALVGVTLMVRDQVRSGNRFNSVFQRLNWFQDSLTVWGTDPWFGAGLRWWYTDRFTVRFQPPNAEIEVLTTAGVVGLAAFLVMVVGSLVVLGRMDPLYGTLALAVLICRLAQTQFDLYWVTSQASIPLVVVGICLGTQAHAAAAALPPVAPRSVEDGSTDHEPTRLLELPPPRGQATWVRHVPPVHTAVGPAESRR
jgi:hypothetical protein